MTATDKRAKGETLADLSKNGLAPWYSSDVLCHEKDVYRNLRTSHKTSYTYSLEWCQFRNENYLVRQYTSERLKKRDPCYKSLSAPDWYDEEYRLEDELPKFAIPNPWTLSETFLRNIPGVQMYWVSIDDRIHETSILDEVLSGLIDHFQVFGLDSKKRKWTPHTCICKRRKIVDSEPRTILSA